MQRNYPGIFSPVDDQDERGSNLKTSGRRFQISLSQRTKNRRLYYILVQPFVLESLLIFL